MPVFLLLVLVLVAVVLGLIGALVEGLFYLLVIGILVFLAAVLLTGVRMGRRSRDGPPR
ncbi:MAG: hypothetical protein ACRDQB_12730 [Thermocrispum sp.]